MENTPNIDSLLSLANEIKHLKRAKDLLWEMYNASESGDFNFLLRSKVEDYLGINMDE